MATKCGEFALDPDSGSQDSHVFLERPDTSVWLAAVFDAPEWSLHEAAQVLKQFVIDQGPVWYDWVHQAPVAQLGAVTAEIANRLNSLVRAYGSRYQTTMILAICRPPFVALCSVGDSPAYVLDPPTAAGALLRVCRANSYSGGLIVPEAIRPDDQPVRYIDSEYLGAARLIEASEVVLYKPPHAGAILVLASDGLEEYLTPGALRTLMRQHADDEAALKVAIDKAILGQTNGQYRTKDDVTYIIFKATGEKEFDQRKYITDNIKAVSNELFKKKEIEIEEVKKLTEVLASRVGDIKILSDDTTKKYENQINNLNNQFTESIQSLVDSARHSILKDLSSLRVDLSRDIESLQSNNNATDTKVVALSNRITASEQRLEELSGLIQGLSLVGSGQGAVPPVPLTTLPVAAVEPPLSPQNTIVSGTGTDGSDPPAPDPTDRPPPPPGPLATLKRWIPGRKATLAVVRYGAVFACGGAFAFAAGYFKSKGIDPAGNGGDMRPGFVAAKPSPPGPAATDGGAATARHACTKPDPNAVQGCLGPDANCSPFIDGPLLTAKLALGDHGAIKVQRWHVIVTDTAGASQVLPLADVSKSEIWKELEAAGRAKDKRVELRFLCGAATQAACLGEVVQSLPHLNPPRKRDWDTRKLDLHGGTVETAVTRIDPDITGVETAPEWLLGLTSRNRPPSTTEVTVPRFSDGTPVAAQEIQKALLQESKWFLSNNAHNLCVIP